MPQKILLSKEIKKNEPFLKSLARAFQSGRINFILGAGASLPGIRAAGDIESEVQKLFKAGKSEDAIKKLYSFLKDIQEKNDILRKLDGWEVVSPTFELDDGEDEDCIYKSLRQYVDLLWAIEKILVQRKTTLLPKQANIFTTNYDLFIEKSSELFDTLRLNDGFDRRPNLQDRFPFSPKNFFNSIFNNGNAFGYQVEIPTVNLIKVHGSLSWRRNSDQIYFDATAIGLEGGKPEDGNEHAYIDKHAVVLPRKEKFKETTLDRTYYDLLRVYSNELDAENTLLISFGFSFRDEHIYDITKRALKNPTLKLVIFCYDEASALDMHEKFSGNDNVEIISTKECNLDFSIFNEILEQIPFVEA